LRYILHDYVCLGHDMMPCSLAVGINNLEGQCLILSSVYDQSEDLIYVLTRYHNHCVLDNSYVAVGYACVSKP